MQSLLSRKMRSARFRLAQAFERWNESAAAARKQRHFDAWLDQLRSHPPQVLVGSNFAEFGGVRGHIHAIEKYSSLNVELAPPDNLLRKMDYHDVQSTFKDRFMAFDAPAITAAHSHVFPWFIDWCRRHRERSSLARWVHTYHLPYFPEHSQGELEPWQQRINESLISDARHADVKISVSRWQQVWLSENHGIDSVYVPNGVDIDACEKGDARRFSEKTGMDGFVLYVGRNDPVKNPSDFVRLAERMPRHQFVMIGRELSSAALLANSNVIVPPNLLVVGDASHSEVQDAIAACSVVVVTSKREGLPTIVLEAMAHSRAVVVPDEAGCVEAIGGGEAGLIYLPGDVGDLADKTVSALRDRSLGNRGRELVMREYDWRVIAPRLDAIYKASSALPL